MHELPAKILRHIPAGVSRGTPTSRLETQLTLHHELRCGRQLQPAGKKFIYLTTAWKACKLMQENTSAAAGFPRGRHWHYSTTTAAVAVLSHKQDNSSIVLQHTSLLCSAQASVAFPDRHRRFNIDTLQTL